MGAMASQITSLTIFYTTAYSGADQRKHQRSAPLAFVWGIHRDTTYVHRTCICFLGYFFTIRFRIISCHKTYRFEGLSIRCTKHLRNSCSLIDVNARSVPSQLPGFQNVTTVDLLWWFRYISRPLAIMTRDWPNLHTFFMHVFLSQWRWEHWVKVTVGIMALITLQRRSSMRTMHSFSTDLIWNPAI